MKKQIKSRSLVAKLVAIIALAAFAAAAQAPATAPQPVEVRPHREPLRQLGRGVSNIVTGVWEIPFNMYNVAQDSGDVAGATYGVFRGVWRFCVREVIGVFETVTFPVGWGPIIEPEFPFEPGSSTDWRVNRVGFSQD